MKNKRGKSKIFHCSLFTKDRKGSHVGMIASFGIFVLFLVGIYLITQPVLTIKKDKQLLLDKLELKLIEEFSSTLTTVIINSSGNLANCPYILNSEVGQPFETGPLGAVKDKNGNLLNSGYVSGNPSIDPTTEQILWAYYSFEFSINSNVCSGNYIAQVKSIRKEKRLFESKILNGIGNFSNLSQILNLPPGDEFSIAFRSSDGTVTSGGEKNVSRDMFVKEVPVLYIDKNASNLAGEIIIKIW